MASGNGEAWRQAREAYIAAIAILIAELARREMRDAEVWINMLRLEPEDIDAVRFQVDRIVALRRWLSGGTDF